MRTRGPRRQSPGWPSRSAERAYPTASRGASEGTKTGSEGATERAPEAPSGALDSSGPRSASVGGGRGKELPRPLLFPSRRPGVANTGFTPWASVLSDPGTSHARGQAHQRSPQSVIPHRLVRKPATRAGFRAPLLNKCLLPISLMQDPFRRTVGGPASYSACLPSTQARRWPRKLHRTPDQGVQRPVEESGRELVAVTV